MKEDLTALRELARRYAEIAAADTNAQNMLLHKKVNDRCMERPIVLIDELPWAELENDELRCTLQDPVLRALEQHLRRTVYRHKYFAADMVVPPYVGVGKVIHTTGIGVQRKLGEHEEAAKAHTYEEQIRTMDDVNKIHNEVITYDEAATKANFVRVAEAVGDIVPVKITGEATGYGLGLKTWDDISQLKNMETLLYDLIDEPELMHALVRRLTDVFTDKIRQYNALNLFDEDAYYCHSTAALSNDLRAMEPTLPSKRVWGRGLAQILATVSPAMHKEFDIDYMVPALADFGLVYYGCCEPLHLKIDILRQIKNLRKISITPWADYDMAAQSMGPQYVMAAKANPAALNAGALDTQQVKKELTHIMQACKRGGCSFEITLKDISSVGGRLENLVQWEKTAMELVKSW